MEQSGRRTRSDGRHRWAVLAGRRGRRHDRGGRADRGARVRRRGWFGGLQRRSRPRADLPARHRSGADGPIVVFTEGFGDRAPSTTASAAAPHLRPRLPRTRRRGKRRNSTRTSTPSISRRARPRGHRGSRSKTSYRSPWRWMRPARTSRMSSGESRPSSSRRARCAGRRTWERRYPEPSPWTRAGRCVTTLGGRDEPSEVVALDAESGEEPVARECGGWAWNLVSAPIVADGRVLALDVIGGVIAFDADDGRFLWRTEVINPIAPRGQPFLLQGVGAPAPVSADGQVFAVDVTGRVYAFDAETGAPLWDHALNDPSQFSPPLLTSEHVLVPSDSGTLYAIDRRSGHLVGRVDAGGRVPPGVVRRWRPARRASRGSRMPRVGGVRGRRGRSIPRRGRPRPRSISAGCSSGVSSSVVLVVGAVGGPRLARPLQRRLGTGASHPTTGPDGDAR